MSQSSNESGVFEESVAERISKILLCEVCNRKMRSAESYNVHIGSKQHLKYEKRRGLPHSQPLLEGEPNYYETWPPTPLACSSPNPEKLVRQPATSRMCWLRTRENLSRCGRCIKTIEFNELCFEFYACGHRYHEKCYRCQFYPIISNAYNCANCSRHCCC
jgi:Zinc-finger of C2H2 type